MTTYRPSDESKYPPILSDLPAGKDALDFSPYAEALTEILRDPATGTPLTLGVFGRWGSGKTSLMRMVQRRVARSDTDTASPSHRTLWFNAWKYNQEHVLWRALLLLLLDDLEQLLKNNPPQDKSDADKAANLMERLRRALYDDVTWTEKGAMRPDWGQALTAGAGLAFNLALSALGLGLVDKVIDEARKATGKGEPVSKLSELAQAFKREEVAQVQAQLTSLEQFQANFQALVALLLGEERRLVVFIDDLDRCVPEKAIQVLEALKLFLDVPGCCFVLGLDPAAVEAAVRARYKGEVKARTYLEKIVQVPFILPPIEDAAMRDYVASLAPSLPDPRCLEVFALGLSRNPREVKRTLNIFLLLNRLVEKRAVDDAFEPVRLATLVAIQHAHPDFYDLLRLRPGYLLELARYVRASAAAPRGAGQDHETAPALPEALQPFAAQENLRRLLLLFDQEQDADACFDPLSPQEVRDYITLTRRSTVLEAPAVVRARLPIEPELVVVEAGPFWMGTSDEQIARLRERYDGARDFDFSDEQPQHEVTLPAFEIGRYPVTNAEYAAFVREAGYKAPHYWPDGVLPEELADHPVVYVTWDDARAYVAWLSGHTDQSYRLPTEAEWEKAARGAEARLWPWGDDWDPARCNTADEGPGSTTPVGQYSPSGDSPYSCADIAGNVWEWCCSLYRTYPYNAEDGRENLELIGRRVLRGGSWHNVDPNTVRCAYRGRPLPDYGIGYIGFRVTRKSPW